MNAADLRAEKIVRFEELRAALAVHAAEPKRLPADVLLTGCAAVDEAAGGLWKGAINEFCGSTGSGPLFLELLFRAAARDGWHLAVVDAADSFDPSQYAGALLRRMLWVRCQNPRQALRSADLLLRDGNLPLVVLDLQAAPAALLRKIPSSTWHRYARILEASGIAFLVMSARPMAEGAKLRIHSEASWEIDALVEPRHRLAEEMRLIIKERVGAATRRRSA